MRVYGCVCVGVCVCWCVYVTHSFYQIFPGLEDEDVCPHCASWKRKLDVSCLTLLRVQVYHVYVYVCVLYACVC